MRARRASSSAVLTLALTACSARSSLIEDTTVEPTPDAGPACAADGDPCASPACLLLRRVHGGSVRHRAAGLRAGRGARGARHGRRSRQLRDRGGRDRRLLDRRRDRPDPEGVEARRRARGARDDLRSARARARRHVRLLGRRRRDRAGAQGRRRAGDARRRHGGPVVHRARRYLGLLDHLHGRRAHARAEGWKRRPDRAGERRGGRVRARGGGRSDPSTPTATRCSPCRKRAAPRRSS